MKTIAADWGQVEIKVSLYQIIKEQATKKGYIAFVLKYSTNSQRKSNIKINNQIQT